jgi:hypothetical protein
VFAGYHFIVYETTSPIVLLIVYVIIYLIIVEKIHIMNAQIKGNHQYKNTLNSNSEQWQGKCLTKCLCTRNGEMEKKLHKKLGRDIIFKKYQFLQDVKIICKSGFFKTKRSVKFPYKLKSLN